ncbi:Protein RnfH [Burkholderiales bacterium 8X]|nr:Protein RnfH [Burkholderiales bacterium 8X]
MIRITVAVALAPRQVLERVVELEAGATISRAIAESRFEAEVPPGQWAALQPGIWGRAAAWDAALQDGDRVELCRPLLVDPKVARRERFKSQGSRGTGLFARQRRGGKAGY